MKKEYLRLLPLFAAMIAGLAAWIFHPNLFGFVANPIKQLLVDPIPSELFFHRLKTAAAFSALGALVPIAAIIAGKNQARSSYFRSLCVLTALAILVAISTTWFMYTKLAFASEILSELQAKNPGIPTVASHSQVPVHRIAMYPAYLMLLIIAVSLVRTHMAKAEIDQEGQQAAPRNGA